MINTLRLTILFGAMIVSYSCEKEAIPIPKDAFTGRWLLTYSVLSTRADGEIVWQIEERNNRLDLRDDGIAIEDRGFTIDTTSWFYDDAPPTIILGRYGFPSQFGARTYLARVLEVISQQDNRIELGSSHTATDSSGFELQVDERWLLTRNF